MDLARFSRANCKSIIPQCELKQGNFLLSADEKAPLAYYMPNGYPVLLWPGFTAPNLT